MYESLVAIKFSFFGESRWIKSSIKIDGKSRSYLRKWLSHPSVILLDIFSEKANLKSVPI